MLGISKSLEKLWITSQIKEIASSSKLKRIDASQQSSRPLGCYGGEWDIKLHAHHPKASLIKVQPASFQIQKTEAFHDKHKTMEASPLHHKSSTFKATLDDHVEMHFKEGSVQALAKNTHKYSEYLHALLGTDQIGEPLIPGYGFHIHIDIAKTFRDTQSLIRFLILMYNVEPAMRIASRIEPESNFCVSLDGRRINAAQQFLQSKFASNLPRHKVKAALEHAIAASEEETQSICLEKDDYGKEGTIELRYLQSPSRPEDMQTHIAFIDQLVDIAHRQTQSEMTSKIEPQKYQNIHEILNLVCHDKLRLRQKITTLFQHKTISPVAYVEPAPESWQAELNNGIKSDDGPRVEKILTQQKPARLEVDGVDAISYSKFHGLNKSLPVLENYKMKNNISDHANAQDSQQFYAFLQRAQKMGLTELQRIQLLKLSPGHRKEILDSFSVNGKSIAFLDPLLSMNPEQLSAYKKLRASGLKPSKILLQYTQNF